MLDQIGGGASLPLSAPPEFRDQPIVALTCVPASALLKPADTHAPTAEMVFLVLNAAIALVAICFWTHHFMPRIHFWLDRVWDEMVGVTRTRGVARTLRG
jgi:hypothetical protein